VAARDYLCRVRGTNFKGNAATRLIKHLAVTGHDSSSYNRLDPIIYRKEIEEVGTGVDSLPVLAITRSPTLPWPETRSGKPNGGWIGGESRYERDLARVDRGAILFAATHFIEACQRNERRARARARQSPITRGDGIDNRN